MCAKLRGRLEREIVKESPYNMLGQINDSVWALSTHVISQFNTQSIRSAEEYWYANKSRLLQPRTIEQKNDIFSTLKNPSQSIAASYDSYPLFSRAERVNTCSVFTVADPQWRSEMDRGEAEGGEPP